MQTSEQPAGLGWRIAARAVVIAADGRGLHDRLLGTLVVTLPREPEAQRS